MHTRLDVEFPVDGVTCRAWHFVPQKTAGDSAPCIVMGHGFGATRDCGLEKYAVHFAAQGLHVLVFDYRHFGASDGQPRQLLSVKRQLRDWQAAIDTARTLEGVDPERVATWGSSFGGGHSLVAAARDGRIAAVSSQCPMMDGRASFAAALRSAGVLRMLHVVGVAMIDLMRAAVRAKPRLLPVAAAPGTSAMMATEDALPGYNAIVPDTWVNGVTARTALGVGFYRPIRYAQRVTCPVLIIGCTNDSVAPVGPARLVAKRTKAEFHEFPIGHFDVYLGEHFDKAIALQTTFFLSHLTR